MLFSSAGAVDFVSECQVPPEGTLSRRNRQSKNVYNPWHDTLKGEIDRLTMNRWRTGWLKTSFGP